MKPRKTFLSQPHLTFETPIQTGCQAQVKTVKEVWLEINYVSIKAIKILMLVILKHLSHLNLSKKDGKISLKLKKKQ